MLLVLGLVRVLVVLVWIVVFVFALVGGLVCDRVLGVALLNVVASRGTVENTDTRLNIKNFYTNGTLVYTAACIVAKHSSTAGHS